MVQRISGSTPKGPMEDRFNTSEEQTASVSVREYIDVFRRRRAIFIQTFLLILVISVVVTLLTPPVYQSRARLLVAGQSASLNSINTDNPLSALLAVAPSYSVATQIQLLQDGTIQGEVARRLGGRLPAFSIAPVEGTEIIEVYAEGSSPKLVGDAPNVLLDYYINEVADNDLAQVTEARRFAERNGGEARTKMEKLEKDLANFKNQYKVVELTKGQELQLADVTAAEGQLQANVNQIATLTSQRELLAEQLKLAPKRLSNVDNPEADTQIQGLKTQLEDLDMQRTLLLEKYQPTNINVVQLDIKANILKRRIQKAIQTLGVRTAVINPEYSTIKAKIADLDFQIRGLQVQSQRLAGNVSKARTRLGNFPNWQLEMGRIQRELEMAQNEFKMYDSKIAELKLREEARRKPAKIISRSSVPGAPIRPKKLQNIGLGVLLALFFAVCFALLQEYLDDRINSPEDVQRSLRLTALGAVPSIPEEGLRLIAGQKAFSPIVECYRGLRTNLGFASIDAPIRSLGVTSSVPGEGKSTTMANLAMALALDGKRVIIVDADLRRPQQHKIFKVEKKPGLTDLLLGTATIAEVLKETPLSPIRIIPAGSTPPNPAELLGSDRMQQVINALQELADIVLYDAPPTLAVADATLLASKVDGILFVVGAGETRRSNAKQAMDMLRQARINVLGTVVNKAPTGQRGYGYGYGYGYSYGYGYGYYAYSQPYAPQVGESAATATIEAAESTLPNWDETYRKLPLMNGAHSAPRTPVTGGFTVADVLSTTGSITDEGSTHG